KTLINLIFFTEYCPYDKVKSQKGKDLILVDGYTFSKTSAYTWTCSTRNPSCKAKLTLNANEDIVKINNVHCHPPKQYVRTKSGILWAVCLVMENKSILDSLSVSYYTITCIKTPKAKAFPGEPLDHWVNQEFLTLMTNYFSEYCPYETVKSRKGKDLILVDGYTFSRSSMYTWICSTRNSSCKAKLIMNSNDHIVNINNVHSHPRKRFVRTKSGVLLAI
ncbi:uncharacterized protein LOC113495877, partial [Trichoplusia ni]|uniref:Uncharacterized protein LOC113495877 n=1 Tax=Trichoplusia ni TaxID=7111 RepID=A0A7E5VQX0_TRINI